MNSDCICMHASGYSVGGSDFFLVKKSERRKKKEQEQASCRFLCCCCKLHLFLTTAILVADQYMQWLGDVVVRQG